MKKPKPAASSVPSLVKDLVDQFDRPLDFYRELIQNSIDAGSNRIDVVLDHADDKAVIRVEDDGEGMDEHVIDNYLLVLFSSTKEDDFTKIGKFGIGFVSVFALRPDMVRVWTAKGGESWRLDFPSYKRYDKYRLSEPREGTLVELAKRMTRKEYDELAVQSREAITYWCKHSEARIFFHDKASGRAPALVTQAFDLPAGHALRHEEEGTEIVLGFSGEEQPFCGYYNRGLTLKEERKAVFPGVEFKAKSRYLEHTLTRDNVLEDDNYRKLMRIMARLVEDELPKRLKADLEDVAARMGRRQGGQPPPPQERARLEAEWKRRLPFLGWLFSGYFARWKRSEWAVFPGLARRPLSLKDLSVAAADADGALYYDDEPNAVTGLLEASGTPVLAASEWVAQVASWLSARAVRASEAFIAPKVLPDGQLPAPMRALLGTLRWLDERSGSKYREIVAADFDYPGSCIRSALFTTQKEPGALSPAGERPVSSLFWLPRARRTALLNAAHPSAQRLARLHAARPGLAAYLALKMMHLHDGVVPPEQKSEYSNLAEKVEAKLLEGALKLDTTGGSHLTS